MADVKLPDYPAHAGAVQFITVDHSGPASYTTGGETLGAANLQTGISVQGLASIDQVLVSGVAVSGNFWCIAQPTGKGSRKTYKLLWFTAAAGVPTLTQVTAATNLSAETIRLTYVG